MKKAPNKVTKDDRTWEIRTPAACNNKYGIKINHKLKIK